MGKKLYYFRFEVDAFDKATDKLDPHSLGIYMRLLIAYYKNQGPLPASDWAGLYRATRCHTAKDRRVLDSILNQFCDLVGDVGDGEGPRWRQRKADETLNHISAIREQRAASGAASAFNSSTGRSAANAAHKNRRTVIDQGRVTEKGTKVFDTGRGADDCGGEW